MTTFFFKNISILSSLIVAKNKTFLTLINNYTFIKNFKNKNFNLFFFQKNLKNKILYFVKTKKLRQLSVSNKKNNLFFIEYWNLFYLQNNFVKLLKIKINLILIFNKLLKNIIFNYKKTLGEGFLYIRGLFLIFFLDASFTDDEPLWEPIEWSLIQTWLLFIFIIAWIAENLITSRFGSYTGRDKRVWFSWYKTFWWIECWYALCYGAASMFVIVPFYYELTYNVSFLFSWWNWCNRSFFFKFISTYSLLLYLTLIFQLSLKWWSWKKQFFFVLIVNFFFLYLIYTQFIITFFAYFTDPTWYQKTRIIDYIQLSHEPQKWGWGPAKRDHFTYHKTSTVFWFKNDGPYAEAFLMINIFLFLSVFFTYIYWLILLRRLYTNKEITFTFTTFCISSLKQFFYFFFLLYLFIIISFITCYWRFPVEFFWMLNTSSWILHFIDILKNYYKLVVFIFF